VPPIAVTELLDPESIVEHDDGYILDFGQNIAGWIEIQIENPDEGETITLEHAELLHEDGTLDQRTLNGADARDTYITKGKDVEIYEPRFTYHGFRYAKVSGYPGQLSSDAVTAKIVHTSNQKIGSFECSNEDLNGL